MTQWRIYFSKMSLAVALEKKLHPRLVTYNNLPSTANSDIENNTINLNVSQEPLKTALSYAYELKNIENTHRYKRLNEAAKRGLLLKAEYVNAILKLEAEAAYFRCEIFRE